MSRKILAVCFGILLLIGSSDYTFAEMRIANNNAYITKTVTNEDRNFQKAKVDKEISIKKKKYILKKVSVKMIAEKTKKTIRKKIKNLKEKKVPDSITEGGVILTLTKVSYKKNKEDTITETYKTARRPELPKVKKVMGNKKYYLENIEELPREIPVSVPAKFYGDKDTAVYMLGEKAVNLKKPTPRWQDCEKEIKSELKLKGNVRITGADWTSPYKEEDGNLVREAKYYGTAQGKSYIATYTKELSYIAIAQYEKKEYIGEMTARYQKKSISTVKKVIIASLGIFLIAGFFAATLLFLRRKRDRKEEKQNT
ncbi:MAG: hypothetical protein ACRCUS_02330 [Anaerovoracaceae bacterium]